MSQTPTPTPPCHEQVCPVCGCSQYGESNYVILCLCQSKAKKAKEHPITRILDHLTNFILCPEESEQSRQAIIKTILFAIEKAGFILLDIHKFEESLEECVKYMAKVRTDPFARRIAKEIPNASIPDPQTETNESLCEFGCAKAYPCNLVKRVRELEEMVDNIKKNLQNHIQGDFVRDSLPTEKEVKKVDLQDVRELVERLKELL